MAIREGAWDCPHCGRKGNRGPVKFCPGCGSPRGEGVQFYLPDEAPEVTEAKALERAKAGPDWTCAFCESDNPAGDPFCSSCGASREGGAPRPVIEHPFPPAAPAPVATAPPPPKKAGCGRWKILGCGCLAILFVLALLIGIGSRNGGSGSRSLVQQEEQEVDVLLTPSGFHWQRTVEVEASRMVTREAWEGEVPSGARILSSRRDVYRTERVQTGTETRTRTYTEQVQSGTERVKTGVRDLGNGYFEDVYEDRPVYRDVERRESYQEPVYRDNPIYKTKIRYEIAEWQSVRQEQAAGDDQSPVWPQPRLGSGEREGNRGETYEVVFHDPQGKTQTYTARDENEWRSYQQGQPYRATTKLLGGGIKKILGPAETAPAAPLTSGDTAPQPAPQENEP